MTTATTLTNAIMTMEIAAERETVLNIALSVLALRIKIHLEYETMPFFYFIALFGYNLLNISEETIDLFRCKPQFTIKLQQEKYRSFHF